MVSCSGKEGESFVDIIKSIDRFIDHRMYHYALLINGKWGCGKTYFIRNELMNHLKNKKQKYDVNYLSLYGIKSTDEIGQIGYGHSPLHQIIIRYTYRSAIRYMKGQNMPEWDGDYGMEEFGGRNSLFYDQEFGFKFVDELLQNNTLDAVYVNEVLDRYEHIAEKKGQLSNDPYQLINNWWVSEDEKVSEWLDKIEINIKNGVYSTALFTNLIKLIAQMKNYHVMDEKCDLIYSAMKEYIKTTDPFALEDFERERFILDEETGKIYDDMSSEITKLLNDAKMVSEKQKYEEAIKDTAHWAKNIRVPVTVNNL